MSQAPPSVLRLGTRGSMLARAQSGLVAGLLEQRHPGLQVELTLIRTSGDQITDKPLHELGGKGLFTKELELALLAGTIDFAVHSYKDVPVTMPLVDQTGLIVAAVPSREDPRDVLVSAAARSLKALPVRSRVGTGSLRRRAQLLHLRPDLIVESIRGNIDTRLRKCASGEYDAIVLAMAGVKRAGLFDAERMTALDAAEMLPAAGQGALALQCRLEDNATRQILSVLDDGPTATCVAAERELVRLLGGDCHSPIAAIAHCEGRNLILSAAVGRRAGEPPVVRAIDSITTADGLGLARRVHDKLLAQGAGELLREVM